MQVNGIHHITAVTANITKNIDFYTQVVGLRLVKRSVNQDDVSAYHLFYADKLGSPCTDMTFFDWPHIGPNQRGTDSIAGTAFRVNGQEALDFWAARFAEMGVSDVYPAEFAGRGLLVFEDPDGQRLYLVDDHGMPYEGEIWARPDIPDEFAIRGFYSVVLSIPSFEQLEPIFIEVMNFEEVERTTWIDETTPVAIYKTNGPGGPGAEVWLLEHPEEPHARLGAGGVHHVAFRVKDVEAENQWRRHLIDSGLYTSNMIDRFWFKSIYFRVSNGILFEIATDGPGFGIDEEIDSLGERLILPPFLEPRREEIEANLVPIG